MSLSREETLQFLNNVLGYQYAELPDISLIEPTERLSMLNTLIETFMSTIPFQSVSTSSMKPSDRCRPSWDNILSAMFSQRGGRCFSNNQFFFNILTCLGYDASICQASVVLPIGKRHQNDHSMIVVRSILKEGDLFYVDVACIVTSFHAIPIDFEEESPVYDFCSWKVKLRWDENKNLIFWIKMHQPKHVLAADAKEDFIKWISEMNPSSDASSNTVDITRKLETYDSYIITDELTGHPGEGDLYLTSLDSWTTFYRFNPDKSLKDVSILFPDFDHYYGDVRTTIFHRSTRATVYRGKKVQSLGDLSLVVEDSHGELIKCNLLDDPDSENLEVVFKLYAMLFPQYPQEMVKLAIENSRAMRRSYTEAQLRKKANQ